MPDILYRDSDIAVLNKPADIPLLADRSGQPCLWDSLPELLGEKPFMVHRIDKPTSGVLLIALNQPTQSRLTRDFQQRNVRKYYLAWVTGQPPIQGFIDLPLKKGRKSRYRVAGQRADIREQNGCFSLGLTAADGHSSQTRFRKLHQSSDRALMLLQPLTGRTHQLRVQLSWIGHPILGDRLYGKPDAPGQRAPRLQLHSHRLVIPGTGSFVARAAAGWLDQNFLPMDRPSA